MATNNRTRADVRALRTIDAIHGTAEGSTTFRNTSRLVPPSE